MIKKGEIIEFNRSKKFKYLSSLGSGGTGDAHLFEDETTDMLFAIKKYSPKDESCRKENYQRFVEEIKILFKISHPNIVRIYNYYLYPESELGYLQMEYIDGNTIDEFALIPWGKPWHEIFLEVISAFEYLEKKGILHRDIRPANILLDKNENVKIIDFGFGKNVKKVEENKQSFILNWPVTNLPSELDLNREYIVYDHQTEVYFVGKLFQSLLGEELNEFRFNHIIKQMIKENRGERFNSFKEVRVEASKEILSEIDFTSSEKNIYTEFADSLCHSLLNYYEKYEPIDEEVIIMNRIAELIRCSSLENYVQDNSKLISCFIKGRYSYRTAKIMKVKNVIDFYQFIKKLKKQKLKLVLDNIFTRLAQIKIEYDDEFPF